MENNEDSNSIDEVIDVEKKENLSKSVIEGLIIKNSSRIKFQKNSSIRKTSSIWKTFEIVFVDDNEQPFVRCEKCKSIISYQAKTGTSSLNRHQNNYCCASATKSAKQHSRVISEVSEIRPNVSQTSKEKLQNQVQPSISSCFSKKVPQGEILSLNNSIVLGLAKDLRPLGAVEGEGFRHLSQSLIDFGAKHGHQNASKVIFHRTTLKRQILPSLVSSKQQEIISELSLAPQSPVFTFTTDMWSDKFKQRSFISLSIHYIDSNWKLVCRMLAVDEFEFEKKTTDNIRMQLTEILHFYFNELATKVLESSYLVTDGGSNMTKLFPSKNHLNCQCHKLNLFVMWMLNNTAVDPKKYKNPETLPKKKLFALKEQCPKIDSTIQGVKAVVSYFKRSGLNAELEYSLKQEVPTRWNSTLIMLESYMKSSKQLKKMLLEKNQLYRLSQIDDQVLETIINFLKPFHEATEVFSKEKKPTIHEIAPWWHIIFNHIQDGDKDLLELKSLKQQARECYKEYCCLDTFHYVATLLNPKYRKLKFASNEMKELAYLKLKSQLVMEYQHQQSSDSVRPLSQMSTKSSRSSTSSMAVNSPKSKVPKLAEFEDSSEEERFETNGEISLEERAEEEFERYMKLKLKPVCGQGNSFSVLEFWSSINISEFPGLTRIAQRILGIPSSQTSDERVFSSTGNTLGPRRTNLEGSTLSSLTFVHKNFLNK